LGGKSRIPEDKKVGLAWIIQKQVIAPVLSLFRVEKLHSCVEPIFPLEHIPRFARRGQGGRKHTTERGITHLGLGGVGADGRGNEGVVVAGGDLLRYRKNIRWSDKATRVNKWRLFLS